jgi:hypothetical protein
MATAPPGKSGITFDLRMDPPIKELNFKITRFTEGVTDFRGLWSALAELFKREMGEQFETEGSISGGRWAPLTEPYKKWKQEHYPGRKIGVLTGALRSSMTGGGGWSQTITKRAASFGMSSSSQARPYASAFDERRKVIRITSRQGRDWQKVTHTWLVAEQRNAFGTGGSGLAGVVRGGGATGRIPSALAGAR